MDFVGHLEHIHDDFEKINNRVFHEGLRDKSINTRLSHSNSSTKKNETNPFKWPKDEIEKINYIYDIDFSAFSYAKMESY